MMTLTMGVLL
ncbi:hypothetical protein SPV_2530 [Streptococcus pneumoniae]|nr:hypothetical protein SPV_2530 [Streptococcus pneumoniae]